MGDALKETNSIQNALYSGYEEWKEWQGKLDEVPSATNHDYFSREMKRANIPSGSRILEVGFGNGEFLQWAKVNGFKISGVEIRKKLYQLAKEKQFNVFLIILC